MALTPQQLHHRLGESARRLRWTRCLRVLTGGLVAALAALTAGLLLDAHLHLGATGRWLGFLFTLAPLLGALWQGARMWRAPVTEAGLARRIEGACPEARNVFINAVQFDKELPADSALRGALFAEMPDLFPRVQWAAVFDRRRLRHLAWALAAVALLIGGWAALRPAYFKNSAARIFLPASAIAPLTQTQILELRPGDALVVHGSELAITATLGGVIPNHAWVSFREAGSGWRRMLMQRAEEECTYRWAELRQTMDYFVEAGDARSATHRVRVRPRTAIRAKAVEIEPPAYTRLPKIPATEFVALQGVWPGSKVTATLAFNYPLAELRALDDRGQPCAVEAVDATQWRVSGVVLANRTWKFSYRDTDNFSDSDSVPIHTRADEPPKIQIITPPEGAEVVAAREAELDVQFVCADNFALGLVALYRATAAALDGQLVNEWPEVAGRPAFAGTRRIPLRQFAGADEERVTFVIVARDQNDVTGPGVTFSRPVVVTLRSAQQVKQQVAAAQTGAQQGLEDLIQMQHTNLAESRGAARAKPLTADVLTPLLTRQAEIAQVSATLAAAADMVSPKMRELLRALNEKEMQAAVRAFRNAIGAPDEGRLVFLAQALEAEVAILARLQGAPDMVQNDGANSQIADLLASIEDLLRRQRDLHRETTKGGATEAGGLAARQDALADQSRTVRRGLETAAQQAPLGDREFAARLQMVAGLFGEWKIYEDMLGAAESLQNKKITDAAATQQRVITNLSKLIELLNQWRLAQAEKNLAALKKTLDGMQDKLAKLAEIQKEIVAKSKELARTDEFRPDDLATAKEIKELKEKMAAVVEQMLTDAHIFPDLKPGNELRSELVSIYEDVIQADKEEAAAGALQPQEIAVQKEDGILQAIEQAQKIAEDMEMWLPNKLETQKWLMENFDVTEMPSIPMLPLPDAFEDLVGQLLDEQQGLDQEVQDAASNQAFAQNPANGWDVRDGPMPGFGAQGRSGNERPNQNEQTGRSSGGREGMSAGEMAGDTASKLEGSTPEARRTREQFQQGQVQDDSGPSAAPATGGGKVSGFSDRQGLEGNAPLRPVTAPRQEIADALAVQQALLAEKTSRTYAQANLLYLRADELPAAIRLMQESELALKEGRFRDYRSLHEKVIRQLNVARGKFVASAVVLVPKAEARRTADKHLLGGAEGEVPDQYKDQVADYYRALAGDK